MCRKCSVFTESTYADEEVTLDDDVRKRKAAKLSYLGDVLSSGEGVQEADTVRCGWKKFKDIASVLRKKAVPLKLR